LSKQSLALPRLRRVLACRFWITIGKVIFLCFELGLFYLGIVDAGQFFAILVTPAL